MYQIINELWNIINTILLTILFIPFDCIKFIFSYYKTQTLVLMIKKVYFILTFTSIIILIII